MPVSKSAEIATVFAQLLSNGLDHPTAEVFRTFITECKDDGSGLLEFFKAVLEQLPPPTRPPKRAARTRTPPTTTAMPMENLWD
jgi:hypothetical protein